MANQECDYLVIGTGLAGLSYALKMASSGRVVIVSKKSATQTNTRWAQGGVAAVIGSDDTFDEHIQDTLVAGAGLCREDIVRMVVEQAPERIDDLIAWGVEFDAKRSYGRTEDSRSRHDLTREGGHTKRRILHVQDRTGRAIHEALLKKCKETANIQILEDHFVIDVLTSHKLDPSLKNKNECLGAYILDIKKDQVFTLKSKVTVLATGGAGKVYLYTTNWEGATGDGIALAYRAGVRIANMEFMQFHPTCLYHPPERSFLISEAVRGEGGVLVNQAGEEFMNKYHPMGSLAPRDIVARSIDAEMKRTGAECVYLDITHKPKDYLVQHFPEIFEKCLSLGIDISKQKIPVVPAAHYLCGGVVTDKNGMTDVQNLFAIGETACTGLHGANRLASNSLLECMVFGHNAANYTKDNLKSLKANTAKVPDWVPTTTINSDEMIVISHMWEEIRRLMWNYVGIVRANRRLERAHHRLENIMKEVREYYFNLKVHPDILELRNIALVAHLTVQCALSRKESRGIHYNIDYPEEQNPARDSVL